MMLRSTAPRVDEGQGARAVIRVQTAQVRIERADIRPGRDAGRRVGLKQRNLRDEAQRLGNVGLTEVLDQIRIDDGRRDR